MQARGWTNSVLDLLTPTISYQLHLKKPDLATAAASAINHVTYLLQLPYPGY